MSDVENVLQREIVGWGVRGTVDYSPQKLSISVRIPENFESSMGFGQSPRSRTTPTPLLKVLPEDFGKGMISAASLSLKSKIFDDGLYAAVELLVDAGSPTVMGKTDFVGKLVAEVLQQAANHSAQGVPLLSALELLRTDATQAEGDLRVAAIQAGRLFLDDMERSKPIGFFLHLCHYMLLC
jgi:hypothetical protein